MIYRTKDGDVLDALCRKQYGKGTNWVEEVIAANPGLARLGPVLPSGVLITFPDVIEDEPEAPAIRLWS